MLQIQPTEESESGAFDEDAQKKEYQPDISTAGETEQDLKSFPPCMQASSRPSEKTKREKMPHRELSKVTEDLPQDSIEDKRDLTTKV